MLEESSEDARRIAPSIERHAADLGQRPILGREWAIHPIVHDEQHVGAVLLGREARCVGQVVPYVKGHPGRSRVLLAGHFRSGEQVAIESYAKHLGQLDQALRGYDNLLMHLL